MTFITFLGITFNSLGFTVLDLAIFKQAFSLIAPLLGNQLKKKLEGTSSVISFLRACGFDSLKDTFGSIYAHAIMEYGVQGIEGETEKEYFDIIFAVVR
jgi:hypothetical protein